MNFDKRREKIQRCDGKCDIFGKVRSHCKQCRYQRCLDVGMDPNNILDEQERKKYSHPKKKKSQVQNPTGSEENQIEELALPPLISIRQPTFQLVNHSLASNIVFDSDQEAHNERKFDVDSTLVIQVMTYEEKEWLKRMKTLYFESIYSRIKYDSGFIMKFIDVFSGKANPNDISIVMYVAGIYKQRFRGILIEGFELDLRSINPLNFGLCHMASIAKGDSLPTLKHAFYFHTRLENLDEIEKLSGMGWNCHESIPLFAGKCPDPKRIVELQKKVASFLHHIDIYFLVMMFLLTFGSENTQTQQWNGSFKRLILKRLRQLCSTSEAEQILNTFCNNFFAYTELGGGILQMVNQ